MAACCGPARVASPARLDIACPRCADPGRTVNNITVASLVREARSAEVGGGDYNICMNRGCPVAYYDGQRAFTREDVKVRISFKEEGPGTICYCHDLREEDVIAEMRRNPKARSFTEVAAILGLNSCSCERHHPLGGNCACAAEVGLAVKKGRADPIVVANDRRRDTMKKIIIFERNEGCCGPSPAGPLVSFLERKYRGAADVRAVNLAAATENVPVPVPLLLLMQREGSACLPALVVDGAVVAQRELPGFMDAVRLIEERSAPHGGGA